MKIGDEVMVHGCVDEIRKDTVIIRNKGGYFGTDPSEVIDIVRCKDCKYRDKHHYCGIWGQPYLCNDECFCSYGEREGE